MLLDEEEIERRLLERREVARAFKTQRKEVENRREQDRMDRNAAKERQLQEAEDLQVQPGMFSTSLACLLACLLSCLLTTNVSFALFLSHPFPSSSLHSLRPTFFLAL